VAEIVVTGDGPSYRVEVRDGAVGTVHDVEVPADVAERLGWDPARRDELVQASFEFLLEREPATSILRRFDLEVVGRYFPEFPAEISRRA
jgi:hypothetical protein